MNRMELRSTIQRNNFYSLVLLAAFPSLLLGLYFGFLLAQPYAMAYFGGHPPASPLFFHDIYQQALASFQHTAPLIVAGVAVWFVVAYLFHHVIISRAAGAQEATAKSAPVPYALLRKLCRKNKMAMPKLYIIPSPQLNAFASGMTERTYTVTLTEGIIAKLDEDELEAVIGHELTHIMNRDVRLLVVSVIFVGILSFASEMLLRRAFSRSRSSHKNKNGGPLILFLALAFAAVGYVLALLFRFALSRKREFMADAGAVQMTKNPDAMIRALEKISGKSNMQNVDDDIRQMMFDNQLKFMRLFATHPPIKMRIKALKRY